MVDPDTPVPTPNDPIYYHTVGVFEGAGYQAKGIYRPYYDCTMKSKISIISVLYVKEPSVGRLRGARISAIRKCFIWRSKNISK